jgi:DDE family transposase
MTPTLCDTTRFSRPSATVRRVTNTASHVSRPCRGSKTSLHRGSSSRFKDFKNALAGDRLSCSGYVANAFRLCLHAAAYRLMTAVRDRAAEVSPDLGRRQFDTLRLKLLKVGALVSESVRRIRVRLPRSYPLAEVFAAMLQPAPT